MRTTSLIPLALPLLVLAACGGDDSDTGPSPPGTEASGAVTSADPDDLTASDTEAPVSAPASTEAPSQPAPPSGGSGGTATVSLANGEAFEFTDVLCSLEPQMAAGSEILFTATSYGDPGLDITQFGDEGTVTGIASVSVYDGSFETLWLAESSFEAFGGRLELSLDGSTISGSGTFYPGGDPAATPVEGEVVATC